MSKANKPQDVSGTSPGLANSIKEVKTLHDGIVKRDKDSVQDAIRIGNLLPEIQASRGRDWKTWVGKNCGFSYMQARIYMRLALWVADGGKLSTQDRLMSAYQKAGIKKKADPKPGKKQQHCEFSLPHPESHPRWKELWRPCQRRRWIRIAFRQQRRAVMA